MSKPFFSVVIPVFNRAHLVLPTLQSVKQQSFSDWECILVDDGSRDSELLRELIKSLADERFRYVWRANGGGAAARNTGIDAARGNYIALLDSDDTFLPGKLGQDHAFLNRPGNTQRATFCPVLLDRGVDALWKTPRRAPRPDEDISEYLTCHQGFIPTSSLVLSRERAASIRYDENLPFGQDTDFAMRLAAAGVEIVMLERPLVHVRDDARPDRISNQMKYLSVLDWTDRIRPFITPKAYRAYRGWHVARLAAPFDFKMACRLYLNALFSGSLPLALATKAFMQIAIPRHHYRRFADHVARLLGTSKT